MKPSIVNTSGAMANYFAMRAKAAKVRAAVKRWNKNEYPVIVGAAEVSLRQDAEFLAGLFVDDYNATH